MSVRELDLPPPPADPVRDAHGRPRSVLFLHNNYYHFYYLARALRERGWDALSVSVEPPDSPNASFYHGVDVCLWHEDHEVFAHRIDAFNQAVAQRFRWIQFSGDGMMAVSPWLCDGTPRRDVIPHEFLSFRDAGLKIGYTVVGCTDGNAQTTWDAWTGRCSQCSLQDKPDRCSDVRNLAWAHKRDMFCDMIAGEQMPRLDYNGGPKVFSEPLTLALDEEHWRTDLAVPAKYRVERGDGEVIVFHAVGAANDPKYFGHRNYKGTPAIVQAVEELHVEGVPVRYLYAESVPSRDMRYLQAQADIVVDQLNFTRYGAFAREAMMLGKPVIGLLKRGHDGATPLASLTECPIVSVGESGVKEAIRALAVDSGRRRELGAACRAYALKWHAARSLALRFEGVFDHVMAGGVPSEAPVLHLARREHTTLLA